MATERVLCALSRRCPHVRVADTSEGAADAVRRRMTKLRRNAAALRAIRGADTVYISVNVGRGMWLSSAAAAIARMSGARVFLHHHSYSYVRRRTARMRALTSAAGPSALHITLSATMADDLRAVMPEIRRVIVVGNAALVDQALLDLPLKRDGAELVLGHLSNLRLDKGIAEVVDLAVELHRVGAPVRLLIAGPTADRESVRHLDRAERELGPLFEYLGPVVGPAKLAFYGSITHFVFPSRYVHEAVPLVLYEAMAAGVVCLALRQGSIAEQLAGSPGRLAESVESFVRETAPGLVGAQVSAATSNQSRQAFLQALTTSEKQLDDLTDLLVTPHR
ncbi:glycosyltransferase family 4 protein [Mycolicibacterium canariasense]|nr:glycosyltransferase family 4 protein [Mycolicibacterium canariasense]MCV7212062.1 glycosyltransferase family 4 protein [Mycolicibacterium canariasense]